MLKGNYYDEEAMKRRRLIKIKKAAKVILFIAFIILIVAVIYYRHEVKDLKQEIRERNVMIEAQRMEIQEPARGSVDRLHSLGTFEIYHYCPCAKCCGTANRITATGTTAEEGRTIAVDPAVIPLGTTVIIDGHEYTAEDAGGGITGNRIDIFVESHEKALSLGVKEATVFIKGGTTDVRKDLP